MTVDRKIEEVIKQIVIQNGQSEGLSRRFIAWFNAVASGNEDINDRQSANRHLEEIYREVRLSDESGETRNETAEATSPDQDSKHEGNK